MSFEKGAIPQRSGTVMTHASTARSEPMSDDDAIPDEDTSEITTLFAERLRGWKHACGYLENYIAATEKLHAGLAKDYEKVNKTISTPLREGHHFDPNLGGIAGLFDNIRTNTQAISNSHAETAKQLKGSVLPTFERLHTEVKNKSKELVKGAGKGSKAVEKARNLTQKHIELLGQHSASFDSTGGKVTADNDPYVLQRGVMFRLNKQIQEENANRSDLLSVQDNFASFEVHIVRSFQQGLGQFNTIIAKQDDISKSLYGDMVATAQRVPGDFEWEGFVKRFSNTLLDPNAPERNINFVSFPNQDHRATVPLISGSLERKSKVLRRYETGYYVVTPSKFLHEYKTDDDFAKDPSPENSLFLPDCVVGAIDGTKFEIKGKDVSKGKMGINLATSHNYSFKAHTAQDASQWWEIVRHAAGQVTADKPESSTPNTPASPASAEGERFGVLAPTIPTQQHPGQETGTTPSAVPVHAAPSSIAPSSAPTYATPPAQPTHVTPPSQPTYGAPASSAPVSYPSEKSAMVPARALTPPPAPIAAAPVSSTVAGLPTER